MTTPTCCSLPMREHPTITHGLCHVCSKCGQFTCQKMQATIEHMGLDVPDRFPAFLLPEHAIYRRPSLN